MAFQFEFGYFYQAKMASVKRFDQSNSCQISGRKIDMRHVIIASIASALIVAPVARAWAQSSVILPLETVVARIGESAQGTVVAVELEREKGRWVYEAKVIAPDGRLIEMYIDARTGAVNSQRARRNASWD
jgi:uncharacterized membrane protein YkoI